MSEKSIVEKIEIKSLKASSGTLSVFEKKISFERAYWIEAVKGKKRGFHAHRNLSQIMFCVSGSIRVDLWNLSKEFQSIRLNCNSEAILIKPGIWREFYSLEKKSILMVLCDGIYDQKDYDYEETKYKIP